MVMNMAVVLEGGRRGHGREERSEGEIYEDNDNESYADAAKWTLAVLELDLSQ